MTDAYTAPQSDLTENNTMGSITGEMISALSGTKGWVQLIAVLMLIGAAFMVLAAVGMIFGGAMMGTSGMGGAPTGMITAMGVLYLLMAALYIFPALYLFKYGSAIGRLVSYGQTEDMETALHQQRKFWKFAGIIALIFCVIMVLGMVAAVAVPFWIAGHH